MAAPPEGAASLRQLWDRISGLRAQAGGGDTGELRAAIDACEALAERCVPLPADAVAARVRRVPGARSR